MKKLFNKKDSGKFRNNNKGSYGGDRRFNRGGDREFTETCKATCAECGNTCQVPFKPTGSKPVYCSTCFRNKGGDGDRSHRSGKPAYRSTPRDRQPSRNDNEEVVNQLRTLNKKMDSLMQMLMDHTEKPTQDLDETDEIEL